MEELKGLSLPQIRISLIYQPFRRPTLLPTKINSLNKEMMEYRILKNRINLTHTYQNRNIGKYFLKKNRIMKNNPCFFKIDGYNDLNKFNRSC